MKVRSSFPIAHAAFETRERQAVIINYLTSDLVPCYGNRVKLQANIRRGEVMNSGNINRFSLHAMYRNRLIRAYLGASRVQTERERTFNSFTGFDNLDNPAMSDLRFDEIRLARWMYAREIASDSRTQLTAFHALTGPPPAQLQGMIDRLGQEITALRQRGALREAADHLQVERRRDRRALREGGRSRTAHHGVQQPVLDEDRPHS